MSIILLDTLSVEMQRLSRVGILSRKLNERCRGSYLSVITDGQACQVEMLDQWEKPQWTKKSFVGTQKPLKNSEISPIRAVDLTRT